RRGGEDRVGKLLRLDERLRQLLARDRPGRLVLGPRGAGDVPASHALDVDAIAVLHEHGAAGERTRLLESFRKAADVGRDEVVRHDLLGLAEPEVRKLCPHAALVGYRRREDGVVRREPVARDDDELVAARFVNVAHLSTTEESCAVHSGFEKDAHSGRMPLSLTRHCEAMSRAISGASPWYSSGRSRIRRSSGVNFLRYSRRSVSCDATSRSERDPRSASRVKRRTASCASGWPYFASST